MESTEKPNAFSLLPGAGGMEVALDWFDIQQLGGGDGDRKAFFPRG